MSEIKRRLQIGVMGSAADLQYSKEAERAAGEIGRLVAESDAILFFGAEKDYDSLSTAAARGAKKAGGTTVGVTYGKGKDVFTSDADIIIPTGLDRGGGREFVLVLSCDAIIALGGGSGTLTEIAIAYQAGIPVIVMNEFGGWAGELADRFLDARRRFKTQSSFSPSQAVELAIKNAKGQQDG